MRSAAGEDQEGERADSWPAYPARRSLTVRDWLLLALIVVFVVLFGLPAFLIVVLDAVPLVGDWLTAHVPFWDEVTDFYNWLWSLGE